VTALEVFLTYPSSVETTRTTVEQTVIPLVTVHTDGSRETNYKTVTATANVTGIYTPPSPTDPFAHLTWHYEGATLTYPTTYVQFYGLEGGLFTPVVTAAATSCAADVEVLDLPVTYDPMSLIVEVPAASSLDLAHPTGISAPAQIHSFLNGIPAVSSQFSGTNVRDCQWTKIPKSKTTAQFTITKTGETTAPVATNQKVTVSVL
jgi:hypothetical protein